MTNFINVFVIAFALFHFSAVKAEGSSTIELNFDRLTAQSDTIVDSIQACNSYTWIDGNTYYQSNYSAIYSQSPDSIYKLALTIDSLDVQVQLIGNTLYSSVSNTLLQWVDCDNNYTPIILQNAVSFTPTKNGNYAVIAVTVNCSDTSNCVALNNIGIEEASQENIIEIYPNPSKGKFFIEGIHTGVYSVFSSNGEMVLKEHIHSSGSQINLSKHPKGMYFLILDDTNNGRCLFKLLKQ
jgi:hypothetical protein